MIRPGEVDQPDNPARTPIIRSFGCDMDRLVAGLLHTHASMPAADADLRDFLKCSPVFTLGEDPTSRISIYYPSERVTVTRVVGNLSTALTQAFEEYLEPRIVRGNFYGIHDWTQMRGYDLGVPPRLAAWTVARLPKIARIVIASDDPIVGMAVRTANLTIKRVEHVATREQFFAALGPLLSVGPSVRP